VWNVLAVYTSEFTFKTGGEFDIVDITGDVSVAVSESGIKEGIAVVFAGHATGIIVLNEYEGALLEDLKEFISNLFPPSQGYHHPVNADAHLRSMLFTPSRVVPVHNGRLSLGTWQSLYWVEAERRPRRRRVEVTVVGE
jgi:secondary thiamine-phosphate synthase enzyme